MTSHPTEDRNWKERFHEKFPEPLYSVKNFGVEDYKYVGEDIYDFISQEIAIAEARGYERGLKEADSKGEYYT